MSTVLLCLAGATAGMGAQSNPAPAAQDELVSISRQFVQLLAKKDYAAAVGRFDATLVGALPEPKLREAWEGLQAKTGAFQKQLGANRIKVGGYDAVLVTCLFEQASMDVKVVFDAQSRITGLFFVPVAPGRPPYAKPGAYQEKSFTVGRGEWQLPGTLTLPKSGAGPWPAVVLVHGSGPNDRDETVGVNKPFRDLALGLASRGIAVLRYEKRTRQYPGKWAKSPEHFTPQSETIDDALTSVEQLRTTEGIDPKRVFVLGHSLGGILAPRIGKADANIAGLILMAGCLSRPPEDVWVEQVAYLLSLKETPSAEEQAYLAELKSTAAKVKKLSDADASSTTELLGAPPVYWLDFRGHNSLAIARQLKQPLLVLQGGRDYQTGLTDFNDWKKALGDQPRATFKLYPKLNHLFLPGEGKSTPQEYLQPGHVEETVVADIAGWIAMN